MIACAAAYRYDIAPQGYQELDLLDLDANPNLRMANVGTCKPEDT